MIKKLNTIFYNGVLIKFLEKACLPIIKTIYKINNTIKALLIKKCYFLSEINEPLYIPH